VDADLLLKGVQRHRRDFMSTIFGRDVLEVGVAALLLPYWFYAGIAHDLPWTWWLAVPGLLWVGGFIVVDRIRHKQKPSEPGEPLLQSAQESLRQVEHQMWLLRNVLWWYLLPLGLPILAFFAQSTWRTADSWSEALGFGGFSFAFVIGLYWFIYHINQVAVRKTLEPQRQELRSLLASLGHETAGEVSGDYPILMNATGTACSPRRRLIGLLCVLAILLIGIGGIYFLKESVSPSSDDRFPKKAPFSAVRWQDSRPEIAFRDNWYELVSLDDVPAYEIVVYSQKTYGADWQKRFEEDLVELLTRMGHPPGETVKLVVRPVARSQTLTLEKVPMTTANRKAIYDAARARERSTTVMD
jgi:hypothetical protein